MRRLLILLAPCLAMSTACLAQLPSKPGSASPSKLPPPVSEEPPAPTRRLTPAPDRSANRPAIFEMTPAYTAEQSRSSETTGPLEGYNFPGFIAHLSAREFSKVPDDVASRRHVFSLITGFSQVCGERSRAAALAAMGYVDPRLSVTGDMVQGGLQIGMQMLLGMAEAQRTGRVGAMLDSIDPSVNLTQEGREDGAMLASRLGCMSAAFRDVEARINELVAQRTGTPIAASDPLVFQSLASRDYRERNRIADPEPRLRERRVSQHQAAAKKQCASSYEPTSFCECVLNGMQSTPLSEAQWGLVGGDFGKLIEVAKQSPTVAQTIRACARS